MLVIVNEGETRPVTLPALLALKMAVYTTDADHACEKTFDGKYTHRITVPEKSITTVVIG